MDLGTVIGLIGSCILLLMGIGPANIGYFIDPGSVVMVVGGTGGFMLINYPLSDVTGLVAVMKNAVLFSIPDPKEEIERLSEFAAIARRDGLLGLEEKLNDVGDPFFLRGIQLAIDGTPAEKVREIMELEIDEMDERHGYYKGMVDALGAAAPSFGMIGTLVGLVLMLQNLDDPAALGPGMAVALITTFYGAVLANVFFIPIAGILGVRKDEEKLVKNLIMEGILSVQAGDNPNLMKEKLIGFLKPKDRPIKEAAN